MTAAQGPVTRHGALLFITSLAAARHAAAPASSSEGSGVETRRRSFKCRLASGKSAQNRLKRLEIGTKSSKILGSGADFARLRGLQALGRPQVQP